MLKWPDQEAVWASVRLWRERLRRQSATVVRVGVFGSYARGDWGVGSDVDLIVEVTDCEKTFDRRWTGLCAEELPVPADVLVYTRDELVELSQGNTRFGKILREEVRWL